MLRCWRNKIQEPGSAYMSQTAHLSTSLGEKQLSLFFLSLVVKAVITNMTITTKLSGLPRPVLLANAGDIRDAGSIPGLGKSSGGRHGNPLQYSCLESLHGQRSLVGYSP